MPETGITASASNMASIAAPLRRKNLTIRSLKKHNTYVQEHTHINLTRDVEKGKYNSVG